MNKAILHVEHLSKRYGGIPAVDGVVLTILSGEIHAIIGPNGAGKTTLLSLLSGELAPNSGRIFFEGRDITRLSADQRARIGIGRSFQHSSIFKEFTAYENVRLAAQSRLASSMVFFRDAASFSGVNARAEHAIRSIELLSPQLIAQELSHGEQRQIEVAMLLATVPKLMLLDEPFSGMGPAETKALIGTLRKLGLHHTLVLVEHDMDVVFTLADRVTVLNFGTIVATGVPEDVRQNARVRAAYLGEDADG